ncbi:MAG: dihydropteroate synthase [Neisseriaceae bacterium]|nr:dihydropteroate synthase [Neisseriaceae bacterium]
MQWQCGRFSIDCNSPKIMGIVNLTPDSFSDGGVYSHSVKAALQHAEQLVKDGADILDIGGESTRPNALPLSAAEEWQRVSEVLQEIATWQVPISLDTRHTLVMQKALENSVVDIINDVAALTDTGAVKLLSQYPKIGICLMHMQGLPENMQHNPQYHSVCDEVKSFLQQRINECVANGIAKNRLLLDPGIGFGKTVEHNLALLANPTKWLPENLPYLIGVSRKSVLGAIIGETDPQKREVASVAAAVESVRLGANVVRVHNVKATREAMQVMKAYQDFQAT